MSVARRTFYDLLKVEKNASAETITDAFKRLALKFHPDKVVHLGLAKQKKALRRMQAISEAYSTLRDPRARALYDRCLREGLDFAVEQWNLNLYDEEEQKPSGKVSSYDEASKSERPEAKRAPIVLDEILGLPGMMNSAHSSEDEYFDYVIRGRMKGHRYLIHIKELDTIGVEDLMGIMNYADQIGDESNMLLTKAYHSYVLLGRGLEDSLRVRAATEQYNARMSRSRRGEPVRGLVLITEGDSRPYVPYGEYLCPSYGNLNLS